MKNLANALLILGVLYLYLRYGLDERIALILVIFGVITWFIDYETCEARRNEAGSSG